MIGGCLLGLLLIWDCCGSAMTIKNRRFVDSEGRQIIYRGPNVVVKVPPYLPVRQYFDWDMSFSEKDLQLCKEWGFNSIRLGVMWAGVQPLKDQYNETYLQQMVDLVNLAGSYGIHTLVQFHQDLIAEKFCGDGVPTWLIDELHAYRTFPFPLSLKTMPVNASGIPDWDNCLKRSWPNYYMTYDVMQTYANLYNPKHQLNHKFRAYWRKVASYFKDNPYVIAYELINQPWIGNLYRNPILLFPPFVQFRNFQQFYDILAQQIRSVDTGTPLCFQPLNFDNELMAGFTHPPGGKRYENMSIMCYHYYSPPAISINTIKYRIRDAQRLNIPCMMSELEGDSASLQTADNNLQSWMFWDYKTYGKNWGSTNQWSVGTIFQNGTVNVEALALRSRTYMQLTAGKLLTSTYIHSTGYYHAIYEATPHGTSILYLNKKYNYPQGYTIELAPTNLMAYHDQNGYISIKYTGNQTRKTIVTINKI